MAFWNRNKNRGREPTADKPNTSEQYKMVTTWGEHYYSWNGRLYDSDIIRACIRPKVKAIGKLVAKHIQENKKGLKVRQIHLNTFKLPGSSKVQLNPIWAPMMKR